MILQVLLFLLSVVQNQATSKKVKNLKKVKKVQVQMRVPHVKISHIPMKIQKMRVNPHVGPQVEFREELQEETWIEELTVVQATLHPAVTVKVVTGLLIFTNEATSVSVERAFAGNMNDLL